MKRVTKYLAALLIAALTMTQIIPAAAAEVYGAEGSENLYTHLDMGVYVVAKVGGKWADGQKGGTVPYKLRPTFNAEVEVKQALPLKQAVIDGVWKWGGSGTTGYGNTTKAYYDDIFMERIASSQTDMQVIIPKGKTIEITQSVKLEGYPTTYDICEQYRRFYNGYTETVTQVTASQNQAVWKEIRAKEAERTALINKLNSMTADGSLVMRLKEQIDTLTAEIGTLKKSATTYSTKEEVIHHYTLNVQGFLNEVYKFWGGAEGLKATNLSMWQMMQNMAQLKAIPDDTEYYLVFIPTVIQYTKEGQICTVCEDCVLTPGTDDFCTDKSCKDFGKPECGCYLEPVDQIPPPQFDYNGCQKSIKWSESQSHTYKCSGCKTRKKSGKRYCPGHTCSHNYTYQADLKSTASLTAAKPNGNNTTFKSGYGFMVTMGNSMATKQVANAGACGKSLSRANAKKPQLPTAAEVRTNWKVVNKEKKVTQGTTVALAKGSAAGQFVTAANPVSHYNNKQIYTDVALKGTKQKPVKHNISVYAYGGGVNGTAFCAAVPLTFTINGDMYEDDWTVDTL